VCAISHYPMQWLCWLGTIMETLPFMYKILLHVFLKLSLPFLWYCQLTWIAHTHTHTSLQTDNHSSIPPLTVFYKPDALPATQPTASKHWRQINLDKDSENRLVMKYISVLSPRSLACLIIECLLIAVYHIDCHIFYIFWSIVWKSSDRL